MRACEFSEELIAKLNAAVQVLRENHAVWRSLDNLPHEIWRDICDYEGLYQVSNYGRAKSFHNGETKIRCGYKDGGKGKYRYLRVSLCKDGEEIAVLLHALTARAFLPNPENKPVINHIDANKCNNCVWNLEWVTVRENAQHAARMGLIKGNVNKGSKRPNAKLDDDTALQILEMHISDSEEFSAKALAKKFNLRERVVLDLLRGKTYKDVHEKFVKQKALSPAENEPTSESR